MTAYMLVNKWGKVVLRDKSGRVHRTAAIEACEVRNGQRQTNRGRIGSMEVKTDSKQGQMERDNRQIVTKTDSRQRHRQTEIQTKVRQQQRQITDNQWQESFTSAIGRDRQKDR